MLSCVVAGTVPPIKTFPDAKLLFPWLPDWVDLNVMVPVAATLTVFVVGVIVVCVALSRTSRGLPQTRLRGDCMLLLLVVGMLFLLHYLLYTFLSLTPFNLQMTLFTISR